MAMTPQLWSISGIATELGVDRRRVGRALSDIPPDEGEGKGKRWRMASVAAAVFGSDDLDLSKERAKLARSQRVGHDLKNDIAAGELIKADEAERAWADFLRSVRSRVLAVPSRARQRLRHLTAADIETLDAECRDALQDLGHERS